VVAVVTPVAATVEVVVVMVAVALVAVVSDQLTPPLVVSSMGKKNSFHVFS
jgi:hypothetical protein